jgi:hypothetical protein
MSIFEIQIKGEIYEIEADDENDAAKKAKIAFPDTTAPPQQEPVKPGFGERLVSAGTEGFEKMRQTAQDVAAGKTSYSEGALRSMGDLAGAAGKIAGEYIATPLKAIIPQPVKESAKSAMGRILDVDVSGMTGGMTPGYKPNLPPVTIRQTAGEIQKTAGKYPSTARNLGALGNIAGVSLGTGLGAPVARASIKGAIEGTGSGLISAGKGAMKSTLKIKDVTAKLAGRNVQEGAQKIVNDISKFNLQSMKGIGKSAEKAQNLISKKTDEFDNLITRAIEKQPDKTFDINKAFDNLAKDILEGKEIYTFGDEKAASNIVANIRQSLELRGLSGVQTIDKIPEIKKTMQKGMQLFEKGKYNIPKDPLKNQVGEIAYLRLTKELEELVPGTKAVNKDIHDLINVRTALTDAQKRIGNKNQISIADLAILFGGPSVAANLGVPVSGAALAGSVGAGLITKKALGSGRGASALMAAGKALGGKEKSVSLPSVKSLHGNQRGSIGGGYDFIGTPAIRDPATGKIYTGDWRGHKGALNKAENENVRNRLQQEHFLDNVNKPTSNVGFIDKKGDYISRSEAEKSIESKKSLAQMYHDESGKVGTSTEHSVAEWDKFMGRPLSPKMEAYYKQPKTIEQMRTTFEKLAPAEQSAMIERLKKIYGTDWKDYAPLFSTLGMGVAIPAGAMALSPLLNRKINK